MTGRGQVGGRQTGKLIGARDMSARLMMKKAQVLDTTDKPVILEDSEW